VEHAIAHLMAVLVVDGFEIVQIEQREDERLLRGVVRFNPAVKRLVETRAIGDTGQSVHRRFFARLFETSLQMFDSAIELGIAGFVLLLFFFDDAPEFLALEHNLFPEFVNVLDFGQSIESLGGALQLAVEGPGLFRKQSDGFPQYLDDFSNRGFAFEQVLTRSIEVLLADLQTFDGVLRKIRSPEGCGDRLAAGLEARPKFIGLECGYLHGKFREYGQQSIDEPFRAIVRRASGSRGPIRHSQSIGWIGEKLYVLISTYGVQPHMKTPTCMLILTTCLLLSTFCGSTFAQSTISLVPPTPVITVNGNATVETVPDQAIVRIGIVRPGGTAREAQDDASRIGQAILKAIGALGVPAARIQTSRLTITPQYTQQRPGSNDAPHITGYTATNSIAVTLDDLALIGQVVDAGLDNGANQLNSVQFRLKDDATVREKALKLAVAEASGKAKAMAEALSVTLGPLQEVLESGSSVTPLADRGEAVYAMAARASVPTPVSPGQIEVSASVVLKYAIVSKN